ncbi:MAG: hypothetical protein KUG77_10150 [Nannocystaceae bacterium]|nr:hypothetical protein [Nannocystaceae bacterium]
MDEWERRAGVAALLRGGVGRKLAGLQGAVAPLQRAHDLARGDAPLHAPWPALTAYRLGHALMASAFTVEEWAAVESLFGDARAFGHLGPWPHVYRLAAMHRRGCTSAESSEAFAGVVSAYQNWNRRYPDAQQSDAPIGTARTDLFNLIDLAGCFVGADRSALSGHGMLPGFGGTEGPSLVLVSGTTGTAPALARPVAEAEFETLQARMTGALVFRLPATGEPSWRVADGETSHGHGLGEMRLLISLMLGDARSPEELAERATGRCDPAAVTSLRQLRRRLRERLASAGEGDSDQGTLDLKARDTRGRFVLNAPVALLGLVSQSRYNTSD